MQNEMRTRFRAIKSRVIDGTLGESDLVEPYDHILVHVAVGFDPSPDRTPEAFRVWWPKLADNDWTTLLELLGARFPNLEQILAEPQARGSLLDRPLNPTRAEVHVDTVVRSERSEEVQQGVLATVIRIRECLVAPALAYDRELLTHNARDCILSGINDRVAQLSGVSGKGEVFVQQSLRRLDSMRMWFSGDYSDREQLEGCVALLEEVIRNASLELSEHGRRLWKRIFSIRELQHEVARLHALDLGDRRLSKKITLRIHEGSAFLVDHARYLCDTCLRDRSILKTHDTAQFFLFSRGEEESCRNVGGSFVFTVTTDAGEKAYMIRGFNPTQSTAMQIDVGSFFEQFVDMLAMCARHEDIRYILVPYDRYSGRAQTNRPAVMAYISDRYYKDGAEVKLTKHVHLNGVVVVQGCKIRDFGAQG